MVAGELVVSELSESFGDGETLVSEMWAGGGGDGGWSVDGAAMSGFG